MSAVVVTPPIECEWFALCVRPAQFIVAHPILGGVPTCAECVEKRSLADRATAICGHCNGAGVDPNTSEQCAPCDATGWSS